MGKKKRADAEISWLGFLSFISGEVCPVMYYLYLYVLSLVYSTRTHHRSETSDVWNQIARDTQQQQLEARYIAKQMARGSWEKHKKKRDCDRRASFPSFCSFFFIDPAWLLFFFSSTYIFLQSVAHSSCLFESTSTWLNILPCVVVCVCVRLSRTLPMGEDP